MLAIDILFFAAQSRTEITRISLRRIVKRNRQAPPCAGLAEHIISLFRAGVMHIIAQNQRLMEEHIFSLFRGDPMPFPVLLNIPVIPIESDAVVKRVSPSRHNLSICLIYTIARPSKLMELKTFPPKNIRHTQYRY